MTLNYTYGNDIIVTKSSDTYRGLSGDDVYIISKGLSSNSDITIIDTSGKNIIQLVDDINFIQTKITKDALQITISNNTRITINGAEKFQFELSGNITNAKEGSLYSFDEFTILLNEGKNINENIVSINKNFIIGEGKLLINENVFSWNIVSPEDLGIEPTSVQELIDYIKEHLEEIEQDMNQSYNMVKKQKKNSAV